MVITSCGSIIAVAALRGPADRELQEIEAGAGEARRAQILPGRRERRVDAPGIDLELQRVRELAGELPSEVAGLVGLERIEAVDVEDAAQRRAQPEQTARARRGGFGPYDEPARGDRRKDLIEDARGLTLVGAAQRDLQDVGDVPDELLGDRELLDGALDPPLELAEPLLSRHEIGPARLEHCPSLAVEPPGEQAQKRRLADPSLSARQQRAGRRLARGCLRRLQRVLPGVGLDQCVEAPRTGPEAAEGGQKLAVDVDALVSFQLLGKRDRERMIDALEEGLDHRVLAGRSLIEGRPEVGHVAEALPLREMVAKKRRDNDIFAPPVLGPDNRRTNGRPRID